MGRLYRSSLFLTGGGLGDPYRRAASYADRISAAQQCLAAP
jgi:hypothetical protein